MVKRNDTFRFNFRSLALILVVGFVSTGMAAEPKVLATVNRNEISLEEPVNLTVSVSSSDSVKVSEPRIPNLTDFELMNSWNSSSTSSRLMQENGGMKFETARTENFNYTLRAKKTGRIQIPSFEVVVDGKTYHTDPVLVEVMPGGSARNPRAAAPPKNQALDDEDPMDEADQLFNQLLQRHGIQGGGSAPAVQALPKNLNEVLSVQVEVDHTDVYEGEQVQANWYIFTRGNLLSLERVKFPDLKGFWKEIIEEVPALNFTQEVINGIPYRKALLASHALFPIKAGTAMIDEFRIKGQVQIPSSTFGSFGFGQAYTFERVSDRIKINVKPLPTEGRPSDFTGAVGQFEVQVNAEGEQFPVNQPFNLKVRFEGVGNAKLIELPALDLPPGLELYDTKNESKFFKNGHSYKQFDVLLIPRQEGVLKIPALHFSMFDPSQKKYVAKASMPIEIKVVPNPNGGALSATRMTDQKTNPGSVAGVPQLPDLVLADTSPAFFVQFFEKALFWPIVFLLILLGLGFQGWRELSERRQNESLESLIQSRQKKVKAFEAQGDFRNVGREMSNLYYMVLGELTENEGSGLDIKRLLDQLPPSLRRDLGLKIEQLVDTFQVMGFAPTEAVGDLKSPDRIRGLVSSGFDTLKAAVKLAERDEKVG